MGQGKQRRPKGKFVTTPQSLEIAETVASWMGRSFDPVENQKIVDCFYEKLFADILRTLELPEDIVDFVSGSFRKTTTFAAKGAAGDQIILDESFDFWTWGLSHYACIATFEVLNDEEWPKLIENLGKMLLLYNDAHMHESVREGFWHYMEKYKECLEFSHMLSKGILGFILCHEIAHCQLDHLNTKASKEMELEADTLAAQHFIKLIHANQTDENVAFQLHSAQQAVPLISMGLLALHETWLSLNGVLPPSDSLHPSANERKENIENEIVSVLNEDSAYVYEGFLKAMDDIKMQMRKATSSSV